MSDQNPIDELFRKNLGNTEMTPPGEVWDEVRAGISFDQTFRKKLYYHEVRPPARVWNRIRQTLHPGRNSFAWLPAVSRYAAAALVLLAFSWTWFMRPGEITGLKMARIQPLSLALRTLEIPTPASPSAPTRKSEHTPTTESYFTGSSVAGSVKVVETPTPASLILPETEVQSPNEMASGATAAPQPTPLSPTQTETFPQRKTDLSPHQLMQQLPGKSFAGDRRTLPAAPAVQDPALPYPASNGRTPDAWSVSSLFSPDVSFASARNSQATRQSSGTGLQYTAGVRLGYALNERWIIQSGVQYADQGTMLIPRGEQDNYTASSSFSRLGPPIEVRAQLIDIPVMVRYKLAGEKLRWFVHSGFNANLTGGASSVLVGTGTEYLASRNLSFSVEPTLRRTVEILPNIRPNTLGIFTGVHYRFR